MTLKDLADLVKANGATENVNHTVVELDVQALTEEEIAIDAKEEKEKKEKKGDEASKADAEFEHRPQFPILNNFEKERGIVDLINVGIAVVKSYQSEKVKKIWIQWLQEL